MANALRLAKLELHRDQHGTVLNVGLPRELSAKDFAALHGAIVDKVIKGLTGCSCLSGQIKVVLEDDFQQVMRVDLASGEIR